MKLKLAIAGLLLIVGLALWFGTVQIEDYRATGYTANTGELVEGVVVGQTFVGERDNLSGVAVMMATYSGRTNVGQVRLTLRKLSDLTTVLREATVSVVELGDNQLYNFKFAPIAGSQSETFLAIVDAPGSRKGRAVTVDVDNRDPYQRGSAYILRGAAETISAEELAHGGKVKMDLAFGTSYQVPFYSAVLVKGYEAAKYFKDTWQEERATYALWGRVAMQSMLWLGISLAVAIGIKNNEPRATRKKVTAWLVLLFVLAVLGRMLYAVELPLTNDEGNYLYDASTLLKGKLAGGDGYVKAPLMILWVALWEMLGGRSVFWARMSSVVIGALTMWPIYVIGRELWGRRIGVTAAATWALMGVTVVFNIYVHTQPLAIFWAVSGIATVLMGVRYVNSASLSNEKNDKWKRTIYMIGAGVLLGLGVVSRKSVLALGLVPLMLILVGVASGRQKIHSLVLVGVGWLAVLMVFLSAATSVYGTEGFWEATGFNSAEDGITAVEETEREQVRAYSIRGMTPFFRESLPLIMLSVIGLGLVGEWLITDLSGKIIWFRRGPEWRLFAAQKMAWIIPLMFFSWAWSFFREYEGSSIMLFGMAWLWWAMLAVVVFVGAWPTAVRWKKAELTAKTEEALHNLSTEEAAKEIRGAGSIIMTQNGLGPVEPVRLNMRLNVMRWLLPVVWVGGLVFFYQHWIKFHANYIGEFLPPLAIIAGVVMPELWRRIARGLVSHNKKIDVVSRLMLAIAFLVVIGWSLFVANYVTYVHEHTGTFQLDALQEAAAWAKQNIPLNEPIFTGAAAVPFLSGHEVSLNIAHPRWYAYSFTRNDKVRINTFLPTVEEMLQAYREATWLLLEQQTGFSFLMEYEEIEAGLQKDWQQLKGVENGSNTMTFYKRK